ncbi:MAG TPA: hypothetical protein VKQ36_09720 [Ktedonobacterales bacterium]|nr:hypothetical protein [Ktedonobacterales bacterium]
MAKRYQQARWLILRGTLEGTPLDSIYVFYNEIVGYDLAGFLRETLRLCDKRLTR